MLAPAPEASKVPAAIRYSLRLRGFGVSGFDQGVRHVRSVLEPNVRDVPTEAHDFPLRHEPASRAHREKIHEEIPGGLPAFTPLMRIIL